MTVGFHKRCTISVCSQSDGCGRKGHYGLIPSTALFYRHKEIRALYPIAFQGLKTGVDENMNYTPEVILFQYKANIFIIKKFWGDVDYAEDQMLDWKSSFKPIW